MAEEQTETQEDVQVTEFDKISDWRMDCLLTAGYSYDLAQVIARSHDIDLHRAVELVTVKGCKPSVAALILL